MTHALTTVTACVVGVIADLAAYFALHTLFDQVEDRRPIGPFRLTVPTSPASTGEPPSSPSAPLRCCSSSSGPSPAVLAAGALGGALYLLTA